MNYEEAMRYIEQLSSKGVSLGLERVGQLLKRLGNPQQGLRCIHVAGTNGKGSVCAFLDSVLRRAGFRVGRYISPTIYDYRERIQLNGAYIREEAVCRLLERIQLVCREMAEQGLEQPTAFEAETAMAFLYFRETHCDYVLLEAGMGGRLDSTNIIARPEIAVVTAISKDHTRMLGGTMESIAAEKSGIIKAGCAVVLAPQPAEAMAVLAARCAQLGVAPVTVDARRLELLAWSVHGQRFRYRGREFEIGLAGEYQLQNAAVALEVLGLLARREAAITETAISEGLAAARWPGRFEVLRQAPLVIVDGAHNPAGAQALADTLTAHLAGRRVHLVTGVFRDKDSDGILRAMRPVSAHILCFAPEGPRGLEAERLAQIARRYYPRVEQASCAAEAVTRALDASAEEDVVVAMGSLSTVRDVQQAVKRWEERNGASDTADEGANGDRRAQV